MTGAIALVASTQLRRRWRELLFLGMLAGAIVALVMGATAAARRTGTAHDRLEKASAVEDLLIMTHGSPELAKRVAHLPGVARSWTVELALGRMEDRSKVTYLGMYGATTPSPALHTPVLIRGRWFDPDPAGSAGEATMDERTARDLGVEVGQTLPLRMLTLDDFNNFDTGFGMPHGPRAEVTITGITRMPSLQTGQSDVQVDPTFARSLTSLSTTVMLRLHPGAAAYASTLAALEDLSSTVTVQQDGEAGEFAPLEVSHPATDGDARIRATERVLVTGLMIFAGVVAAVGLVVVLQAFARHHRSGAPEQQIEAFLGFTSPARSCARTLATVPAALVAAAVASAGPIIAGGFEPLGSLADMEPHPGFAPNLAYAATAAVTAFLVVLSVAMLTATLAASGKSPTPQSYSATNTRMPGPRLSSTRWLGPIWLSLGMNLIWSGRFGQDRQRRPSGGVSLLGAAIGVAGLVATAVVAAGIDRLVSTPARYGGQAKIDVVDVQPETIARLTADARISAVGILDITTVRLCIRDSLTNMPDQGEINKQPKPVTCRTTAAYARTVAKGTMDWTNLAGREPRSEHELMIGSQIARELHLHTGDRIFLEVGRDAQRRSAKRPSSVLEMKISGVGIGPTPSDEKLGANVLFTPTGLALVQRSDPWRDALLVPEPHTEARVLMNALSSDLEMNLLEAPDEVRDLASTAPLTRLLKLVFGMLVLASVAHVTGMAWRTWRTDSAVLRTLGCTPAQIVRLVLSSSCTAAIFAVAFGVPLGFGVGRVAWWELATTTGAAGDLAVPGGLLMSLPPLALLTGALTAVLPAIRLAWFSPAAALRAE